MVREFRETRMARNVGGMICMLDMPVHRAPDVRRSYPHITPMARAGQVCLFDSEAVGAIHHEPIRIAARRREGRES